MHPKLLIGKGNSSSGHKQTPKYTYTSRSDNNQKNDSNQRKGPFNSLVNYQT